MSYSKKYNRHGVPPLKGGMTVLYNRVPLNTGPSPKQNPRGNEMTSDRKFLLKNIMKWYWDRGNDNNMITKSDYEFIYSIWNHGLSFYGQNVQDRLNTIREIYLKDLKDGNSES